MLNQKSKYNKKSFHNQAQKEVKNDGKIQYMLEISN
jgi:hypothetical protein